HPRRTDRVVVLRPAHDGGVAVGGQRDGAALRGEANRAAADQLVSLLGPNPAAAGEHPRRAGRGAKGGVVHPAHESGDAGGRPCGGGQAARVPTSLLPCWVHPPPLRVNTHTAPAPPPSRSRPTMTVLPSTDTATGKSWVALEPTPLPTSLGPCCTKSASEGCAGPSSAAAAITAMAPPRPRRTPRRLAKSNQRASSEVARPHFASAHEIVSAIGCIRPLQRAQTR